MFTLFIESRNNIPHTLHEINGNGPDWNCEQERKKLRQTLDELESHLLTLGFRITRTRDKMGKRDGKDLGIEVEDLIQARCKYECIRDVPNLREAIPLRLGVRIRLIVLETSSHKDKEFLEAYDDLTGGFSIREHNIPEQKRWTLSLSLRDGAYFYEAVQRFHGMFKRLLFEAESYRLARQIVGLVRDFQNGKNKGALQGVINKAERLKEMFDKGQSYEPWLERAE